MKLTRQQTKEHERVLSLIEAHPPGQHWNHMIECPTCGGKGASHCEECDRDGLVNVLHYIFDHFHPGYHRDISRCANFFTPRNDAVAVAQAGGAGGRVIEPTAGIGSIAHAVYSLNCWGGDAEPPLKLTCVELVEDFVAIGRKLVPQAEWICGNIFDVLPTLGEFDSFVANPPFGKLPSNQSKTWGDDIAFGIIQELLPRCHNGGIVILPAGHHAQSANMRNGECERGRFADGPSSKFNRFKKLNPAWAIQPTSFGCSNQWKGTSIECEIVDVCRDETYEPEVPEAELTPEPVSIDTKPSPQPALAIPDSRDPWANL